MDARVEATPEETRRLQRCINDLTSLLALPAIWNGGDPSQVVRTLIEALHGMLRLDFIYAMVVGSPGDEAFEMVRSRSQPLAARPEQAGHALRPWLGEEPPKWPRRIRDPFGADDMSIFPLRLGLNGEFGLIVAGSFRAGFPEETERLVLGVAANQAVTWLQEAWRVSEHKRLAIELDKRIAQRTDELAQANDALLHAAVETARTEEILRRRELDFRLIVDSIPVPVAVTTPLGEVEGLNRPTLEYFGRKLEDLKGWRASDAVHPDDLAATIEAFTLAHTTDRPYNVESRHLRHDGIYRWFNVIGMPLKDAQGQIVRWFHLLVDIDDRKRAEHALSASERNFKLIIDTIPALVWSTRSDGSVEFVNQHYMDYVGLTPEQVLDWGWTAAVHPDDLGGLAAVWRAVLASGKGGEAEARFRRADGEYRWLLVRVNPLHDASGSIIKWYGLNTDIEDRKRADIHLASERHVLEMIASGRPLRDVLKALCGFFEKAASDCFCGIYPIDGGGRTFEFGVAPSLPASYTDPIEGAQVACDDSPRGQSISEKRQVIAEDIGSDARWMEAPCRAHVLEHGLRAVWSTPICSREGSVIGTVCVYQKKPGRPSTHHKEIIAHVAQLASIAIERSQAEAALKRSEFYLTQGQRISLTGTFAWDVASDEITFSDQLKHIWEFEPHTVVSFDLLSERTHPEDLAKMCAYMEQVRAGLDNPDYELRLRMPDGRIKYLWVCTRVVNYDDGRRECLGAIQDITRRRLAEEARDKIRSELAHVSRVVSLGALTASIAHEVNQPLASIVTSGETGLRWLEQPEPSLEKVQQVLKRVVNDARRAADVIDRIRTMASKGAPKQSETTLDEIITECTALLHHEFQSKNVSISLDLAPGLGKVKVDHTQLQQVIVNLVINAVQAMSESGAASKMIVIRTQQADAETVCCIVEDNGPGIDDEHLPRLFDSFFTTKESGMGLGLPIARSIIEAHDGRIRADNNSALGGARLIVELPTNLSAS